MKKGENREAMDYFKLGNNREYYSEAFKRHRRDVHANHFGSIVLVIALIASALFAMVRLKPQEDQRAVLSGIRHY